MVGLDGITSMACFVAIKALLCLIFCPAKVARQPMWSQYSDFVLMILTCIWCKWFRTCLVTQLSFRQPSCRWSGRWGCGHQRHFCMHLNNSSASVGSRSWPMSPWLPGLRGLSGLSPMDYILYWVTLKCNIQTAGSTIHMHDTRADPQLIMQSMCL